MKGAILEKGEKYYTFLSKIFSAIDNAQKNYNWLITDCECYPQSVEIDELLSKEYCWLSGEKLSKIVETEDFQWIWAVLSGFNKDITLEEVLKSELPFVVENGARFWRNPISLQHPLASIEIVPCDSTRVFLISNDDEIIERFRSAFPLSEDLETHNGRIKWDDAKR
jgi:hypothetical protein